MAIEKKHIYWINNLRVLALFAVIILHASFEGFYSYGKFSTNKWLTATAVDSLVRFCVPVFLMITGALLLPRKEKLRNFLQKRMLRVFGPFVFWTVVFLLFTSHKEIFTGFSVSLFREIVKLILRDGVYYHFWYIYMLLGIYLFLPILSIWILNCSNNEILFFLLIWIVLIVSNYPHLSILRTVFDLRYFSGYIGYPVLGYYLTTISLDNLLKVRVISVSMIIIGFLSTFLLTVNSVVHSGNIMELYFGYLTFNVLIESIGIFLFVRSTWFTRSNLIEIVAKYSFGIYFVHVLVLQFLNEYKINVFYIHPIIGITLTSVLCLIISTLSIALINKLPYGRYYVT